MKSKIKNVLQFYELTSRLKNIIRTGLLAWQVSADRLESVAEHVFSTCMLAIAIDSEFDYDIDIQKVIYMLALHELEEVIIGDVPTFDNIYGAEMKELKKRGKDAVIEILSPLAKKDELFAVIKEYDENKTVEARFAKWVDKLDCGLQIKLYDMQGHINPSNADIDIKRRHNLEKRGYTRLSDSWLEYCIEMYGFDENFVELARQARKDENWGK